MIDFDLICVGILGVVLGIGIGGHQGDQTTLRDCAIKGEAKMYGGGSIVCSAKIEKESKK